MKRDGGQRGSESPLKNRAMSVKRYTAYRKCIKKTCIKKIYRKYISRTYNKNSRFSLPPVIAKMTLCSLIYGMMNGTPRKSATDSDRLAAISSIFDMIQLASSTLSW